MGALWRKLAKKLSDYRELVGVSIVALVANTGYGILNLSAIQPYARQMGWAAHIGAIYAAFLISEALFRSPSGALGDHIGRKPVYVTAALIGVGAAFAWTIVDRLWLIMIVQVFNGAMFAGFYTTTVVAMGSSVHKESRVSAMDVFMITLLAGMSVGPAIGGYANDLTNSRLTSFYAASALFLLAAILAYFLMPRRMEEERDEDGKNGEQTDGDSQSVLGKVWAGMKQIPLYMLAAFVIYLPVGIVIPITKLFAMSELNMSETTYGLLFVAGAFVVGIASIVSSRLTNQWGRPRSVKLGLLLSAIGMYPIALIHVTWAIVIAAGVVALGFVINMPAWLAHVSDLADPSKRGALIGALGLGQGAGLVGGVLLGGYLYHWVPVSVFGIYLDSHYTPFLISAFGLSLAFVLALFVVSSGPQEQGRQEDQHAA